MQPPLPQKNNTQYKIYPQTTHYQKVFLRNSGFNFYFNDFHQYFSLKKIQNENKCIAFIKKQADCSNLSSVFRFVNCMGQRSAAFRL